MTWIPVTPETMPEDRQRVPTYRPAQPPRWRINLQVYEARGVNDLAWWFGESNQIVSEMHITHWQPLPKGAEMSEGEGRDTDGDKERVLDFQRPE